MDTDNIELFSLIEGSYLFARIKIRGVQQMMLHMCNADYAADEGDLFGESDHSISNS
jgi:hypothetical protein